MKRYELILVLAAMGGGLSSCVGGRDHYPKPATVTSWDTLEISVAVENAKRDGDGRVQFSLESRLYVDEQWLQHNEKLFSWEGLLVFGGLTAHYSSCGRLYHFSSFPPADDESGLTIHVRGSLDEAGKITVVVVIRQVLNGIWSEAQRIQRVVEDGELVTIRNHG